MTVSGYTEWLLFHLWKKSSAERKEGRSGDLGIRVPNTIIYRWAQPLCWYFNGPDGSIRRKKKEKINNDLIISTFTSTLGKSGIVCMIMYLDKTSKKKNIGQNKLNVKKNPSVITTEYLDLLQFSR